MAPPAAAHFETAFIHASGNADGRDSKFSAPKTAVSPRCALVGRLHVWQIDIENTADVEVQPRSGYANQRRGRSRNLTKPTLIVSSLRKRKSPSSVRGRSPFVAVSPLVPGCDVILSVRNVVDL